MKQLLTWIWNRKRKLEIPLKYGVSGISLDFIIGYFSLKQRIGSHNALDDAKLTSQAFSKLLNEKKV